MMSTWRQHNTERNRGILLQINPCSCPLDIEKHFAASFAIVYFQEFASRKEHLLSEH